MGQLQPEGDRLLQGVLSKGNSLIWKIGGFFIGCRLLLQEQLSLFYPSIRDRSLRVDDRLTLLSDQLALTQVVDALKNDNQFCYLVNCCSICL